MDDFTLTRPLKEAEKVAKNGILLNLSIFRKARIRAVQILNKVFSNLNKDLNDIVDGDLMFSEKMIEPKKSA